MNAQQRRADRRLWKYTVSVNNDSYDRYNRMFDWCVVNFKNPVDGDHARWREKHGHFGTCWQFTDSKAAAAFALKWS
jgi:hypothetical protein